MYIFSAWFPKLYFRHKLNPPFPPPLSINAEKASLPVNIHLKSLQAKWQSKFNNITQTLHMIMIKRYCCHKCFCNPYYVLSGMKIRFFSPDPHPAQLKKAGLDPDLTLIRNELFWVTISLNLLILAYVLLKTKTILFIRCYRSDPDPLKKVTEPAGQKWREPDPCVLCSLTNRWNSFCGKHFCLRTASQKPTHLE